MVIAWIGYCLLVSGLLALAAFASERALGHFRRPVRWAWFAAIIGSVTVPVVAFFAPGLLPGFGVSSAESVVGLRGLTIVAGAAEAPAAAAGGGLDAAAVSTVLGWGWLLMVAAMVGYLGRIYGRLRSEMRTWTPGQVAGSPVMISDERGPAVVGIRRSVVVMPKWIPELEDRLLRLVFLHEWEHQRAGDHRLFAAAVAAVVLMPWNLVMWWQVSRLRLAIEFDCDRRVLERGESPRDYADALITVGTRVSGPLLAAAAFAERKPAVERRLRRMTEPLASMRLIRTLGASGVAMLAVLFALGCPGPESAVMAPEPPAAVVTPPADAVDWQPPPAPGAEDLSVADRPAFVAYDTPPILQNAADVAAALKEAYPQDLKDAGIGGRVELWLYIDTSGAVENTEVKTSSSNSALDLAAAEVARTMRYKPASNRDEPTAVWVSQPITFQVLGDAEASAADEGAASAGGTPVIAIDGDLQSEGAPLIVIDGVIQSENMRMSNLGALDIDNVTIVKGEPALERYGERARDGVVKITTKGGTADNDSPLEENEPISSNPLYRLSQGQEPHAVDGAAGNRLLGTARVGGGTGTLEEGRRSFIVSGIVSEDGNTRVVSTDDPLIIIDGVIQSEDVTLGDIHPDNYDIDNVEILKGEQAIESYGERAGGGVVLVTTKTGR